VLADVPVAEHVAAQDLSLKGERLAGIVAFTRCAEAALLELLARCGDSSLAGRLVFLLGETRHRSAQSRVVFEFANLVAPQVFPQAGYDQGGDVLVR
jgi:hypothetical protein